MNNGEDCSTVLGHIQPLELAFKGLDGWDQLAPSKSNDPLNLLVVNDAKTTNWVVWTPFRLSQLIPPDIQRLLEPTICVSLITGVVLVERS